MANSTLAQAAQRTHSPSDAPTVPAAAMPPIDWRVQGRLLQPARMWLQGPQARPCIEAVLAEEGGPPLRIVQHFEASHAGQYVAQEKAARLRTGTEVRAEGVGLRLGHLGSHACIELLGTRFLATTAQAPSGRTAAANDTAP